MICFISLRSCDWFDVCGMWFDADLCWFVCCALFVALAVGCLIVFLCGWFVVCGCCGCECFALVWV